MERIKVALAHARARREKILNGAQQLAEDEKASGSRLGKDRILERDPFKGYSSAQQEKLLQAGRVLNVGIGETLQFAGDKDAYVHYLLSGAVVLESEHEAQTVSAGEVIAQRPLDAAGIKTHTILAASDAEVLRVPFEALPQLESTTPIPAADYSETYSGQQLANLVEQINMENSALKEGSNGALAADATELLGEDAGTTSLSELSASATDLFAELEADDSGESRPGYAPKVDDDIGRFMHELELRFRRYVEKIKIDERERYERQLHKHAERLQQLAQRELASKLTVIRERYKTAYADKESRLRARYSSLRDFANKIARQKAAIYAARKQIADKLQSVDRIHQELSALGSQLNHQLDDLEELNSNTRPTGTDRR